MKADVVHVQFPRGVKQCAKEPEPLVKGLKKQKTKLHYD